MSKLIIEMEMPNGCGRCPLVDESERCIFLGTYAFNIPNRMPKCPIKGVLPDEHGDLIDRDALKKMKVYSPELHEYIVPVAYVDWQDTVIAAERKDDGQDI